MLEDLEQKDLISMINRWEERYAEKSGKLQYAINQSKAIREEKKMRKNTISWIVNRLKNDSLNRKYLQEMPQRYAECIYSRLQEFDTALAELFAEQWTFWNEYKTQFQASYKEFLEWN